MPEQTLADLTKELEALKKLRDENSPMYTRQFIEDQITEVEDLIAKQLTESNRKLLQE
jgi:hypothetical protein